ncbi:MAG: hypothetical protein WCS42_06000 [Verrucomicrobiota bacterium]
MTQTPTVPEKRTVPTDRGFRLVLVVSTALIFAAAFGWLACIERMENGEVEFHWQASTWIWIATGMASTVYFWRQIWPTQNVSPTSVVRRQIKGWAALMIPSLMWMAYPLRFISGQQLLNVAIGLAIAATVLACGGWMVYRLIQGFAGDEAPPVSGDARSRPEPPSASGKPDSHRPPAA